MALLAAEAVLLVLLLPLGVRRAVLLPAPLAGLAELALDADVEEVGLVGGRVAAGLLSFCQRGQHGEVW